MRKILSLCILLGLVSTIVSPVFAIVGPDMKLPTSPASIVYPEGADFVQLKSLIETSFSPSDVQYKYTCIAQGSLCPNYKYTSIIEKAIKLIVLKTYTGNEAFYGKLFEDTSNNIVYDDGITESDKNPVQQKNLREIILTIPEGSSVSDWKSFAFGSSVGGKLLDASFGLDFTENASSSTMLGSIEQKIIEMKRAQCQKENTGNDSYTICPWSGSISDKYLPTPDELYAEYIYFNRERVQIESLKNEIEYTIHTTQETQNISDNSGLVSTGVVPVTSNYTLRYNKESYTLEEARAVLEKKEASNEAYIVSMDGVKGQMPCKRSTVYSVKVQCASLSASLKEVQTALAAHQTDTMTLPDNLDKLKLYLPKIPQEFTDNFSYKHITNTGGEDYEIRYIGRIGEVVTGSGELMNKKDYVALMSGATIPEIPQIFAHVPADSMVLYIKNPTNLIDILSQKSNTSTRLSGIDASLSIKEFMKTFFELEKFDQIEEHLKHEMAIVMNNLDATAPDIVIILSESDREALSPTAKARVVGSKDGYIYIANSKESLERTMNLPIEKSLKNAPDFHYVWWKKSTLVKDAMMFIGDAFFEKMLTFETYITHYRKYRDHARLSSLQELVWAYGDAFGKLPTGFNELTTLGISTLTGEVLDEYSIVDGIVTHQHVGTLLSPRTLPEAGYDLSKISRVEIEDYQYNVLGYRDLWRASLDPMGIVINRYGDGMEVDFFMTPIPSSPDRTLQYMQTLFEGVTKESLSFVTNPRVRTGLLSFVFGFDPKKLGEKIKTDRDIGQGFQEFSQDILDGKNVFEYLGGEFAFSIGSLDPDIFEGWNVEKVDAYISVQVANEEKGKELIEMLKKKLIEEMGGGRSDSETSMFSILAKPLIEDYNGKKIYYVEAIPMPFVGKIGIAYTFVEDFLIVGINRPTIRRAIDTAASTDSAKKHILGVDSIPEDTFFATLFDGDGVSQEIKGLYEKNKVIIPRYFNSILGIKSNIDPFIASYYAREDQSKRLGKKGTVFHYEIGALSLSGMSDTLIVKIDSNKLTNLSGKTLEMWNAIQKSDNFPVGIVSEQGIPLDTFLSLRNIGDIVSMNLMLQFDSATQGTEPLFRNATFGVTMGNNEIGFKLRVFRQQEAGNIVSIDALNTLVTSDKGMIWILVILLMVLGGGVGFYIFRRKGLANATAPIIPPMPPVDTGATESPVIVPSIIVPQDIPQVVSPPEVAPIVPTPIVLTPSTPTHAIDTPVAQTPIIQSSPIDDVAVEGVVPVIPENVTPSQDRVTEQK